MSTPTRFEEEMDRLSSITEVINNSLETYLVNAVNQWKFDVKTNQDVGNLMGALQTDASVAFVEHIIDRSSLELECMLANREHYTACHYLKMFMERRAYSATDEAFKEYRDFMFDDWGRNYPLEFYHLFKRFIALPDTGVYVMYSVFDEDVSYERLCLTRDAFYKIGFSDAIRSRHSTFECGNPFDLRICHVIETNDLAWCEGFFHRRFRYKRVHREWHQLNASELALLMKTKVLNKPKTIAEQRDVLELQGEFEKIADDGAELFR